MEKATNGANLRPKTPGFRLLRTMTGFTPSSGIASEIMHSFPDTSAGLLSGANLRIVSRREIRQLLILSNILREIPFKTVLEQTVKSGPKSQHSNLTVGVTAITTQLHRKSGKSYKICATLDDSKHNIVPERTAFLDVLSEITGIEPVTDEYVPEITVAHVRSREPSVAKLATLAMAESLAQTVGQPITLLGVIPLVHAVDLQYHSPPGRQSC